MRLLRHCCSLLFLEPVEIVVDVKNRSTAHIESFDLGLIRRGEIVQYIYLDEGEEEQMKPSHLKDGDRVFDWKDNTEERQLV